MSRKLDLMRAEMKLRQSVHNSDGEINEEALLDLQNALSALTKKDAVVSYVVNNRAVVEIVHPEVGLRETYVMGDLGWKIHTSALADPDELNEIDSPLLDLVNDEVV